MKNTYIVVLIILILGVWLFFNIDNKEENVIEIDNKETQVITEEIDQQALQEKDVNSVDVKEFVISGDSYSFTPSVIKVKKGDKIRINFQNIQGLHNFTIDEFNVATKQIRSPATEVVEFTVDKTGSFEYYCSVGAHRSLGMKGILIVE